MLLVCAAKDTAVCSRMCSPRRFPIGTQASFPYEQPPFGASLTSETSTFNRSTRKTKAKKKASKFRLERRKHGTCEIRPTHNHLKIEALRQNAESEPLTQPSYFSLAFFRPPGLAWIPVPHHANLPSQRFSDLQGWFTVTATSLPRRGVGWGGLSGVAVEKTPKLLRANDKGNVCLRCS